MFNSSHVPFEKLSQCSLKLKIAKINTFYETRISGTSYTPKPSWFHPKRPLKVLSLFCIKLNLHLNVNPVCGQRRVCVLFATPRSQQTWTVPTTVGQTAGESPNTPVCRSTWASITRAVSAVYLTMKRPRTPALKWVLCQRENTRNYWTVSNVGSGCQMLAWL